MTKSIFLTGACAILILLSACKKDLSDLGLGLQPPEDQIEGFHTDTITIAGFTFTDDSLSSDERTVSLLGSYKDPLFGPTSAAFVTQIRLSSSNVRFGSGAVADSLVLYLDYRSFYGDTNTQQHIVVYELDGSIYPDSSYYSNLNPATLIPQARIRGERDYYPQPNDTSLAIKLNDDLAQLFVTTDSTNFNNDVLFLEFFKGLYVKVNDINSGGAIIYYDLLAARSKMTLYYHNNNGSQKYDFDINSSCARINLFSHDYSSSALTAIDDSLNPDSILYIQSMSGVSIKIHFPHLSAWKDSTGIAVVRADLVIPINPDDIFSGLYKEPARLLMVEMNSSGGYQFLPDYYLGDTYFGGYYDDVKKAYVFNISRYVQERMKSTEKEYGLVLMASDNRVSANRISLLGPKSVRGMKLALTYIRI